MTWKVGAVARIAGQAEAADVAVRDRLYALDHIGPGWIAEEMRVAALRLQVFLDRDLPALAVASTERTELERSAIFRAATARYEDGQRFLLETATKPDPAPSA